MSARISPGADAEEKAGTMMPWHGAEAGPNGRRRLGAQYDTAKNRRAHRQRENHQRHYAAQRRSRIDRDPEQRAPTHRRKHAAQHPSHNQHRPAEPFQYVVGASVQSNRFSQWPEALGFAAIGDTALTRRFGDIARQEYRAVGIHMALSPQADLATEAALGTHPGHLRRGRRARRAYGRAYVAGFQHGETGLDTAAL